MVTSTTTVHENAAYYNMNHDNQGFAYIFSHDEFTLSQKRNASGVDEKLLKECLVKLGFDVQLFKNLKLAEIQYHIFEATQRDHTNNNCLLIFVLSHGDQNKVEARDEIYNPKEVLWDQFTGDKCPTLAGKPKLFFMQCCRGKRLDPGISLECKPQTIKLKKTETDGRQVITIPVYSDFCISYATAEDHFAFRNEKGGSYFVRVLCEELKEHAYKEHLLTILTFVNRRVAIEFQSKSRDSERHKKKQSPYFECSLTRLMKFVDKKKEEE